MTSTTTTAAPRTDANKTEADWQHELATAYNVDLTLPDTTAAATAFRATLVLQARALVHLHRTKERALLDLQARLQQAGGMTPIGRLSALDHHDDLLIRIEERNTTLMMLSNLLRAERAR